ncbi:hypothetical protein P9281_34635 [Caballeronia sp. LP003]|uniref:hypothetical protein n=1 Tax=Caballeronia sp. LP003 TaxID=3038551 RepID=UPI002862416E|nr:hypothetical protein [Caballeronia sp. LP003]MDR5791686.1 hypothetical protein [Caballeronia sp. LP003]
MAFETIAPLAFLADILKSLITDAAKERLKPPASEKTARKRAFDLYQRLEGLAFSTQEFVTALEQFVEGATQAAGDPSKLLSEKTTLLEAIDALSNDLESMTNALRRLQPQINIHRPDIFDSLRMHAATRSGLVDVSRRRAELNTFARRDLDELQALVATARLNQKVIGGAIEEYRLFVAATFSFKESF